MPMLISSLSYLWSMFRSASTGDMYWGAGAKERPSGLMGGGPGRGNRWWDLLLLWSSAQIVWQVEEDWVNDLIINNGDNWGRVKRNGSNSYIFIVQYQSDGVNLIGRACDCKSCVLLICRGRELDAAMDKLTSGCIRIWVWKAISIKFPLFVGNHKCIG